jgi:hypothetical protein
MAMPFRDLARNLPCVAVLTLLAWMAPTGATRAGAADAADSDTAAIIALMHETWDKPDSKLDVGPVVVETDHAVADWTQGERGGRALLRRVDGRWKVVLCSGDPLRDAANMAATGVPLEVATRLAERLATAEINLPALRRDLLSRFQGNVTMEEHKHH